MVAEALGNACAAGLRAEEFWALTPYETSHAIEGAVARQEATYRVAMFAAWHAAGFQRIKRMPRLDRILRRMSKSKKRDLTPEQIWEGFKLHNMHLGGKDERASPTA